MGNVYTDVAHCCDLLGHSGYNFLWKINKQKHV